MSVFRIHKTKNFTIMSNYHFKEKDMSLKAKGLLSLMLSLPDDWNYNISGLVKLSKDGKDSVMSALGELEKFGYLRRDRTIDNKGRFSGIIYNIFEEPQPENPIAEEQNAEEQNEGKQNAEKPPQLNTKLTNNSFNKELTNKTTNKDFLEILNVIEDEELKQLYLDYIEMRNLIKSPVSKRALSMLIDRCARLANFDIELQKEMMEAAVINNWKSVYLPNDPAKGQKKENNSRILNRESRYSKSGYDALKNFDLNT